MTDSRVSIVGGRLRQFVIERPSDEQILADAAYCAAAEIALSGQGPFRNVTGVCVAVVVGPVGCTCCLARNGLWCLHRSLYLVETGAVVAPKRAPAPEPTPIRPYRERRGWTRRPFPLGPVTPVIPFRPRMTR